MPSNRERRAADKDAQKLTRREAIEKQYGLQPGALKPKPVKHLGRFTFLSRRQQQKHLSSIALRDAKK